MSMRAATLERVRFFRWQWTLEGHGWNARGYARTRSGAERKAQEFIAKSSHGWARREVPVTDLNPDGS